jgi:hypothetical protein
VHNVLDFDLGTALETLPLARLTEIIPNPLMAHFLEDLGRLATPLVDRQDALEWETWPLTDELVASGWPRVHLRAGGLAGEPVPPTATSGDTTNINW